MVSCDVLSTKWSEYPHSYQNIFLKKNSHNDELYGSAAEDEGRITRRTQREGREEGAVRILSLHGCAALHQPYELVGPQIFKLS